MSREIKPSFQIDIFDKKTSHLIQSITGCKTHKEAIEVAASFRDGTRNIVIKYIDSEELNLDNKNGSATEKHYRKRYALEDIISLIQQIKFIDYPPSGRYYEFKDGSTCEDWSLESTIRNKLVEIDHIKERMK